MMVSTMQQSSVTWSSSDSSPKEGMYLAHSTNTSNCCLMESHTSPTLADFCSAMSAIPTGAVIWRETQNHDILQSECADEPEPRVNKSIYE